MREHLQKRSRSQDAWIVGLRGAKAKLDPHRAYSSTWEEEPDASGSLVPTAVIFLTNRECPFRCLMCDLWVHTLDERVPSGAIAAQIRRELAVLPPARAVKLYNAGSFFDPQAIPPDDDEEIAGVIGGVERVVVESHPAFLAGAAGERCLRFRDLLAVGLRGRTRPTGPVADTSPRRAGLQTRQDCNPLAAGPQGWTRPAEQPHLEVAIGLETAHPDTLARLNKRMTVETFERAAAFLCRHDIALRVFILLNPPFLRGGEAIEWACRSIDVAALSGAAACSIIPTRGGNGAMEVLGSDVARPRLPALEAVVEYGLSLHGPRVFADLWDIERFFDCPCSPLRAERLMRMNREQQVTVRVECGECQSDHDAL